jgi:molybdopterin/thiamine biosynthesis adenylyltransferase/rhodanese-related sulfurtransferase
LKYNKEDFYQRQTVLKSIGSEGQEKLSSSKVLVVGAGGLGTPALQYLVAAGIGNIHILDFDKVSYSNLHRQVLFTPDEVGQFKAEVIANKLSKQNPWINITFAVEKFCFENLKHFCDFDLILDCTDNFKAKFLIHDFCYLNSIHLIQASIYQYEGQVQSFHFKDSKTCLRCLYPEIPAADCSGSCNEAGVIGVVPGVVGSMQASEAVKQLLNLSPLAHAKTMFINLLSLEIPKVSWKESSTCKLCSGITTDLSEHKEKQGIYEIEETKGLLIIDIRESNESPQSEFKQMPLSSFKLEGFSSVLAQNEKVAFICSKGIRSEKLTAQLRSQGHNNCYSASEKLRLQFL